MKLRLGGQFAFYLPGHPAEVEVDLLETERLVDVLARLGIPPAEIHLAAVNGELVELTTCQVSQSDVVSIFPPIGGGWAP